MGISSGGLRRPRDDCPTAPRARVGGWPRREPRSAGRVPGAEQPRGVLRQPLAGGCGASPAAGGSKQCQQRGR